MQLTDALEPPTSYRIQLSCPVARLALIKQVLRQLQWLNTYPQGW